MRRVGLLILILYPLIGFPAIDAYQFDDPAKESLYKGLVRELRCLVCQNQNLADSNAELAKDMRRKTYEMVQSGASKEDVITFMVSRYGDFVLYRPPFKTTTALLWAGPFIILAVGAFVLINFIRKRGREQTPELSAEEIRRAEQLLNQGKDKDV